MLESKHYFIDLINSSKANQFTAYYHYSGVGFKKAKINQGIFRKSDNLLVGVLQWGCSAQEGIRLDRYVKEPITTAAYLELNRFCMADSEGKNAESEAISLGIKWIRTNRKDIQLLVSYAGRKEGNYGYIYQATSWEYLGYFLSSGFWMIDGVERHQITLQHRCVKYRTDEKQGLKDFLCANYADVRQTWSKQFIYIKRLNSKLTAASPILPYPKNTNEYPIQTRVEVYKKDESVFDRVLERGEIPLFPYIHNEPLFSRRALIRQGDVIPNYYAVYNCVGEFEFECDTITEIHNRTLLSPDTIRRGIDGRGKVGQGEGYFIREIPCTDEAPEYLELEDYLCIIDDIKFFKQTDVARYCGVSRQAVSSCKKHWGKVIGGRAVTWNKDIG